MIRRLSLQFVTIPVTVLLLSLAIVAQPPDYQPMSADSIPHQIVIKYRSDVNVKAASSYGRPATGINALDQLHERFGAIDHKKLLPASLSSKDNPLQNVHLLKVPSGSDLEAIADAYQQLDIVEYAHPDYLMEFHDLPDDSLLPHQWALVNTGQGHYHVDRLPDPDTLAIVSGLPGADIGAGPVYDNPPDQTDVVVVAIIDSGIDGDHPDLADRLWVNAGEIPDNGLDDDHNGYVDDTWGWDFSGGVGNGMPGQEDNDPSDYFGHGTHCAGIVAAVSNNIIGVAGAAPDARIMAIKAFPYGFSSSVAKALIYAADNDADVVSMSFGGSFSSGVLYDALLYAQARNVILVASAGNSGNQSAFYPSYFSEVMCIAASNDHDQITDFSTFNSNVSVCAPGQSILSLRADSYDPYGGGAHIIDSLYYLASGTSMSGPYVAGVAAYVRSVSPGLHCDSVRAIIEASADDIVDPYGLGDNYPGWDMYSGHGRINLASSLAASPGRRALLDSPLAHEIVGGSVVVTGTADGDLFDGYVLEYRDVEGTAWTEIGSSSMPVTQGVLGTFESDGMDGAVLLRLMVGQTNLAENILYVANSVQAQITSPANGDTTAGTTHVLGYAACPDFAYAQVDYSDDPAAGEWTEIARTGTPVFGGEIVSWSTSTIPQGTHTIRISVYSSSGLEAADSVSIATNSQFAYPMGAPPGLSPNYGDFDNDGLYEIVIGTDSGISFFNLDGTPKTSGVPACPDENFKLAVAVGNLDGDGIDDLVAVSLRDGDILYGFPSTEPAFVVPLQTPAWNHWNDNHRVGSKVYLKDINNDGLDEIHWESRGTSGYYIYRPDGSPWNDGFPLNSEYGTCFPADLDGDLISEIYYYSESSSHLVQFDTLGMAVDSVLIEIDGLPVDKHQFSFSAVDTDNDSKHELIFYGYSHDGVYPPTGLTPFRIWVIDEGLEVKSGWPHNTEMSGFYISSHPIFADLDRDGELEYIISFQDWALATVRVWRLDGTPYLGLETAFFASPPYPSQLYELLIVDADGDNSLDIVTTAAPDLYLSYEVERIVAFDNLGVMLDDFPMIVQAPTTLVSRGSPICGDLNHDGFVDLVYASQDKLVFTNMFGADYYPAHAISPMRLGNRRLNATYPIAVEIVTECGDIDGSGGAPNIADLIYLATFMFQEGPPPPQMWVCDMDGNGEGPDIADLIFVVTYMFQDGPPLQCPPDQGIR